MTRAGSNRLGLIFSEGWNNVMTLSAYCLTCRDASSSLLMCNPCAWVTARKMGPARCACADRTGQARRPPAHRRAVLLRGAHTRSQGKAEAKAVPWVGTAVVLSAGAFVWTLPDAFPRPTRGCWSREAPACLVWEAFRLSSGKLELCLRPQAHLLACQRGGNSSSPTHCLLEGVKLSPESLGTN